MTVALVGMLEAVNDSTFPQLILMGVIMNKPIKCWTAQCKSEIVLWILKRETKLVAICRSNDLKQWADEFLKGGKESLTVNSKETQVQHQKQVNQLQSKIKELVMEVEARKK